MKKFLVVISLFLLSANSLLWSKNKMWSCINTNGQTVFTINAIQVYPYSNELARVYKNTLVNNAWVTGYGYINKSGEVVIPCNLKKANEFIGEYTWVMFPNQDYYTLIDRKGRIIPTKHYKKVGYFYDFQTDVCAVYEDGKMGFIDTTGKEIIPCKYIGSTSFKNGLTCVGLYDSSEGKYGFINKKGEFVIEMRFKQAGTSSFNNGIARVKVKGKTVLIDTTGKVIFNTIHGNIQGVYKDLILVFKGKDRTNWGWVNFKDEVVITQKYDNATNFNEDGFAVVELNGLKGVINTKGEIVIPLKYETVYCNLTQDGFIMGVYPSNKSQSLVQAKKDYYNKQLELLNFQGIQHVQTAYGSIYIPFKQNDKWGFLNRDYKVVIPAQFKRVKLFSEDLAFVIN